MKKIVIAGGTGFLGKALTFFFRKQGHDVIVLTRNPNTDNHIYWDAETAGPWAKQLDNADVLINLTGKSVDCRYNEENKKEILSSRIDSTKILDREIRNLKNPPTLWINASSATIYVHAESLMMTESDGLKGDDFSMNVCKKWEESFFKNTSGKIRKVAVRTSIVLANQGGAYPKMKALSRLGMGGHQGNGNQKVSWIHIVDFCRAIDYVINNPSLSGPVNVTAPKPTSNKYLMRQIKRKVNMPFGICQSIPLLELGAWLIGTETELLLKSRNVYPANLIEAGFKFKFDTIDKAIEAL